METSIPIIVLLLGVIALILEERPVLQRIAFGLLACTFLAACIPGFDKSDAYVRILSTLGGIMAIGLLAGLLTEKLAIWVGLAGTLVMWTLSGVKVTYFGFSFIFDGILIWLPLLGAAGPIIIRWKAQLLQRWTGMEVQAVALAANVFYAAILAFFATFQASFFGVILVASGWLAVALADRSMRTLNGGWSLLVIGLTFIIAKTTVDFDDSWMRGNVLMGIIAGAGTILWVKSASGATRFRWILMYLVPLLVITAMIMMGKANEHFGGIPAYTGALLGSSIGLLLLAEVQRTIPFQALLVGLSGLILTQFAPVTLPVKKMRNTPTETVQQATKEPNVMDVPAIPLDAGLAGNWKSEIEASKLDFKLGPEGGVTKGGVEEFDVKLRMNGDGTPEQLKVTIPSVKVTTFNSMRDESVHGADYLNTATFPKMTYTATSIVAEGDHFVTEGTFTMLGKPVPMKLQLKFAAKGEENGKKYLVMVGKSALDRTKFGMKSDPKIGDVVSVEFEVEFRK